MKIEKLKQRFQAPTSEKLFDISEQPEQQCPKVDRGIKEWEGLKREIKDYCNDIKRADTVTDADKIAKDIEWSINNLDVINEYEELRSQCEKLRAWGQGWKDMAKKLIEEREDVSELISDNYINTEAATTE